MLSILTCVVAPLPNFTAAVLPSLMTAAFPNFTALHMRRVVTWHRMSGACMHHLVICKCMVHACRMHIIITEHDAYIQHAYVRKGIRTVGIAYVLVITYMVSVKKNRVPNML